MFNDKFGLTQAVLEGRKLMTRRICKYNRPDETYDIAFPIFEPNDYDNDGNIISPLDGAFCWRNEKGDFTGWNIPKYKVGEVVAIAQRYSELSWDKKIYDKLCTMCKRLPQYDLSGWNNKLFVAARIMPHHIRITDIKVERLQDISDEDCLKEGIVKRFNCAGIPYYKLRPDDEGVIIYKTPQAAFDALIDKISGKGTWESNPYVFAYEFELVD